MNKVTVVIPTIPERQSLLERSKKSVQNQTIPVDLIVVEDKKREGASSTRNKGIMMVKTEWTAFLDDDDEFLPNHIEFLLTNAEKDNIDLCWPWYQVVGGKDPLPNHRGKQYDPNNVKLFPIAVLCKTIYLQNAVEYMGGFAPDPKRTGAWKIQDFPIWNDIIVRQGATTKAFPDITWKWHHHSKNTSGLGI